LKAIVKLTIELIDPILKLFCELIQCGRDDVSVRLEGVLGEDCPEMISELEEPEPLRPVWIVIGERGPEMLLVFEICIESGVVSAYAALLADADVSK
jgi:hypothetical protein